MQRNTQDWARPSVKGVETLALRDGWTLVLSDIAPGDECAYHHVEPDEVFGIGFHLQGGAGLGARTGPPRLAAQPLVA